MSTHNYHNQYIKKITRSYSKYNVCNNGILLGTQERVRNSRGKRAISVRAT